MKLDNRGIKETPLGEFSKLPDGKYSFVITDYKESVSKEKSYPQVSLITEVYGDRDEFNGQKQWHRVTFIPKGEKGAGIYVHFMHTIGVPCNCEKCDPEGKLGEGFEVNFDEWLGKAFDGEIKQKEIMSGFDQSTGKQLTKIVANIVSIYPPSKEPPVVAPKAKDNSDWASRSDAKKVDEEIPF